VIGHHHFRFSRRRHGDATLKPKPVMNLEFKLPALGENIENGDVVNVLVHEGDRIAANDPVFELETDKAILEIPCPHAGKITKIHVGKGDTVNVGQTLLTLEAEVESPQAAEAAPAAGTRQGAPGGLSASAAVAAEVKTQAVEGPLPAGPAARRLARELGVDLRRLTGTGQRGRITPEDVQAAASGATAAGATAAGATGGLPAGAPGLSPPVVPPGEPGHDAWGPIRRERISKIRRTIAQQMVRSAGTIPHVTNFDDADVTELEHLRKGVPAGHLGQNVKLTTMPFVIKAVAQALGHHPLLSASIDEENEQIIYKQYINLGVAVDTPRGLVVPALRNVDRMSIPQIARELRTLAERARAADFAVEDLRGGTFTVSNLGAVGGRYSTPIINHPEVAILLLGRSRWTPVVRDQTIESRLMMPLSLSFDHRLVDGAAASRFLNDVIDYLQSPGKLLLTP
jgi:pyruvate dehydrogenase E2 component (dihydrolipoamide acetyltransferase)